MFKKERELLIKKTRVFDVVEKYFKGLKFAPVGLNCNDWVMAIVLDMEGNTIIVKQTRWGIEGETIEFPCGTVEKGESPQIAALRELKEETGFEPDNEDTMRHFASFSPNPAYFNNQMHVYIIRTSQKLKEFELKPAKLDLTEDCKPFVVQSFSPTLIQDLSQHAFGLIGVFALTRLQRPVS